MVTFMLNSDGRLEVFIIGYNKAIWHRWQTAPGSQDMTDWVQLNPGDNYIALSVNANHDGRLEVFALREDYAIRHNWQQSQGGAWSGWADLGTGFKAIRSAKNSDGRLEVFALGGDDAIWHNWQQSAGGAWAFNPQSGWSSMGGSFSQFEVKSNIKGQLELYAINKTFNEIQIRWQDPTSLPDGWSTWKSLGLASGFQAMSVAANEDGRLEVFGLKEDHGIWHIWQTIPGASGTFLEWADLGGFYTVMSAGRDDQGRLNVVARNINDSLYYTRRQQNAGGDWTPWTLVAPVSIDTMPSGLTSGLGGWRHRSRLKLKVSSKGNKFAGTTDPDVQQIQGLWNDALQNGAYCVASMLGVLETILPNVTQTPSGSVISSGSTSAKGVAGAFMVASCEAMGNDLDQILDILHAHPDIHYEPPQPSGSGPQTIEAIDGVGDDDDE